MLHCNPKGDMVKILKKVEKKERPKNDGKSKTPENQRRNKKTCHCWSPLHQIVRAEKIIFCLVNSLTTLSFTLLNMWWCLLCLIVPYHLHNFIFGIMRSLAFQQNLPFKKVYRNPQNYLPENFPFVHPQRTELKIIKISQYFFSFCFALCETGPNHWCIMIPLAYALRLFLA